MQNRFDQLLEQSYDAPRGKTKIALLEEAIRIADIHLDVEQSFYARMELIDTAIFSGHGEKAIVAFAWCLAQYDKNPDLSDDHQMMWNYKWIADRLLKFPDIELARVEETIEDLKKRFIESGHGSHYYYYLKQELAKQLEKRDEVKYYYDKWIKEPSDSLSDCRACTLSNQAHTLLYLGRLEEAYSIAEPIFKGKASCHSVPHRTYADFLLPLLKANRAEEAAEFFQKSYQLIHNRTGYLEPAIRQLEYLLVVDIPKALTLTEKYFLEIIESDETSIKYHFYRAALTLFDYLEEEHKRLLHLPDTVTPASIKQELYRLANLFNERNQTDVFTTKIESFQNDIQKIKQMLNLS